MTEVITTGQIATYTGKIINPLDPDPNAIDIEDIARSLSNQCRFTGHTKRFYSVAEHSVRCLWEYEDGVDRDLFEDDPQMALTLLLHDASEAYLSDLARPIKQEPGLGDIYKKVENRLMEAIAEAFPIFWPLPDLVKDIDITLLITEQKRLMPNVLRHPGREAFGADEIDNYRGDPESAYYEFIAEYEDITQRMFGG